MIARPRLFLRPAVLAAVTAMAATAFIVALRPAGPALREVSAPGDPRALEWRDEVLLRPDRGFIGLGHLAALPDRIVGFAYGALGPADVVPDWPQTHLMVSTDGLAWQPHPGPIDQLAVTAITVLDGTAWAFGQLPRAGEIEHQVWTSRDGLEWSRVANVTGLDFGNGAVTRVTGMGSVLLAEAYAVFDVESGDHLLLRSEDGRHWELVHQPRGPSFGLRGITAGADGFVTLFTWQNAGNVDVGEAWHSVDARAWTQHPIPGPAPFGLNFGDIAAGPRGYVAVGLDAGRGDVAPAAWLSPDGRSWRQATVGPPGPPIAGGMQSVLAAGTSYVAFGNASGPSGDVSAAWGSPDGRVWERLPGWQRESDYVLDAVAWKDLVVVSRQGGNPGDPVPVPVLSVGREP